MVRPTKIKITKDEKKIPVPKEIKDRGYFLDKLCDLKVGESVVIKATKKQVINIIWRTRKNRNARNLFVYDRIAGKGEKYRVWKVQE